MLRVLRGKKAQSTAEYAILIGLVVAAVIAMQTYVKRGFQGRMKDAGNDYYSHLTSLDYGDAGQFSDTPAALTIEGQFEPGMDNTDNLTAKSSQIVAEGESYEQLNLDPTAETITREVYEASSPEAGDFRKYDYEE